MKRIGLVILILIILALLFWRKSPVSISNITDDPNGGDNLIETLVQNVNPLSIENLRSIETPGSDLVIEQTLSPGSNYSRYIASYLSDGLKIYGLLTVPNGAKPQDGWPVIIFNHGYIPPTQYVTTERYIAYTDAFSRNGYILFRPDYRGHGNSEGAAEGGYGSNGYTIDVLNAFESLKKYKDADPKKIGMWGHSMGGFITLRSMVVRDDVKAGVIWGGVVASYPDLINNWRRGSGTITPSPLPTGARRWRQVLVEEFGEPSEDSSFWRSLSANSYLEDISGPVQLHHGTLDESVPVSFSQKLEKQLKDAGKTVEYFEYSGDDHDITSNFSVAAERSVEFFDRYVKGE